MSDWTVQPNHSSFDSSLSVFLVPGLTLIFLLMWNFGRVVSILSTSWEVLTVGSYFIFYGVVKLVQKVTWVYNGVQDHLVMAQYGGVYDTCVQVQRIIHRGRFSIMNHPRPWDFTGMHENFAHPQTLLNPKISMYCVTPTHAYFVECPEEIDVHNSRVSPFMYMAQFYHAVKLYSIPLGHFHRLADEVGDPRVPVIWISSTGRCGSTLIGQMLEKLPGTRSMSEPDTMTNISLMARAKELSPEEITKVLRSSIRMICKDAPGVQRIAIKTRFNCVTELEEVTKLFPDIKHIYVYRNLGSVMKSYYKFLHRDTAICLLSWLINNKVLSITLPFIRRYLIHFIAGEESTTRVAEVLPKIDFMGYVTAIICSCIVEFQNLINNKGLAIPTLHYDELMRNPLEVTCKLFQVLDLPEQYVQMSLVAMQHDTQYGTILSNISNRKQKSRQMTGKDTKDMNVTLNALELPDLHQDLYLPNSILS